MHSIPTDEEKLTITRGMLALTSFAGGKLFHAIWEKQAGIVVQLTSLGTRRLIGWKQAAHVVETGQINCTDVGTSLGRGSRRKSVIPNYWEKRRAEYLAEKKGAQRSTAFRGEAGKPSEDSRAQTKAGTR